MDCAMPSIRVVGGGQALAPGGCDAPGEYRNDCDVIDVIGRSPWADADDHCEYADQCADQREHLCSNAKRSRPRRKHPARQ